MFPETIDSTMHVKDLEGMYTQHATTTSKKTEIGTRKETISIFYLLAGLRNHA